MLAEIINFKSKAFWTSCFIILTLKVHPFGCKSHPPAASQVNSSEPWVNLSNISSPLLAAQNILFSKMVSQTLQVTGPIPGPTYDPPSDHDSLTLITDPSLPSHVTRPLTPGYQEFSLTDREVTCSFRINMSENQQGNGNIVSICHKKIYIWIRRAFL